MTVERVMMLIDADNVSVDVMEQGLRLMVKQHGGVHVRRAYCTAESAVKHQAFFKRMGIKPMVNLAAGKNSTDIALAVDAIDLVLAERPDVVVIASSDSDFAPLVQRLREKGCVVRGIGQKGKTGDETQEVYDDYTVIEHRKSVPAPRAAERQAPPARKTAARGEGRGRLRGEGRGEGRVEGRDDGRGEGEPRGGRRADPRPEPRDRDVAVAPAPAPEPLLLAPAVEGGVAPAAVALEPVAVPEAPAAEPAPRKTAARKTAAAKKTPAVRKTAAAKLADKATDAAAVAVVETTAEPAAEPAAEPVASPAAAKKTPAARKTTAAKKAPAAKKAAAARKTKTEDATAAEPPVAVELPPPPPPPPAPLPPAPLPAAKPAPRPVAAPASRGAAGSRLQEVLRCLPELGEGRNLALNVAVQRLREAQLLGKNSSSLKLFSQLSDRFELVPPNKPSQVRWRP